jgi:hypothetical protein
MAYRLTHTADAGVTRASVNQLPVEPGLSRFSYSDLHVFAQLHHLGGKGVRAVTLARNELAIALKCAVCNAQRLVWLKAHVAPARMVQGRGASARRRGGRLLEVPSSFGRHQHS